MKSDRERIANDVRIQRELSSDGYASERCCLQQKAHIYSQAYMSATNSE